MPRSGTDPAMGPRVFSLILLPTLRCNADCDYCFEDKDGTWLTLDRLPVLIGKVLDHLVAKDIAELRFTGRAAKS